MRGLADDPVLALGVVPVTGLPRLVVCYEGHVSVRDLATGRTVAERSVPEMYPARCAVIRMMSGRPVVFAGGPDCLVRLHLDTDEQVVFPLASDPTAVAVGGQVVAVGMRNGVVWLWRQGESVHTDLFTEETSSVAVVPTRRGDLVVATGLSSGSWTVAAVDGRTGRQLWRNVPSWDPVGTDNDRVVALDWWRKPLADPKERANEQLTVLAWHEKGRPAIVLQRKYVRIRYQVGILRLSGPPIWRLGGKPDWRRSMATQSGIRLVDFADTSTGPLTLLISGSVVAVADFPLQIVDQPGRRIVRLIRKVYPSQGFLAMTGISLFWWWLALGANVAHFIAMILVVVGVPFFLHLEGRRPDVAARSEVRWQAIDLDAEVTTAAFAAPSTVVAATPQGLIAVDLHDLDNVRPD
ncbi:hypothetical protein ACFVYA_40905 [Amycolatopsis sp. NPDC058278]|uniref:hypothetical protein n=1 Tax=Amycolatopsis sp. NPDC058278 TaxID=3346417 RepID=UPI0036DB4AC6